MDVVVGIERLTALAFIVTGLSHIAAPHAWTRFFIEMRDKSAVPGFFNAYLHIPLGLLIVAFHPVWSGPGLLVTLTGWALVVKGTLYFLWPQLALRSMAHVSEERAGQFRIAGIAGLGLGLAAGWVSFGAPGL